MRHPGEGVLRRLVDEPAGVADADRRHVADCARCLEELAGVREDAARVGAALSVVGARADVEGVDIDVDAAWQRLSAVPVEQSVRAMAPRRGRSILRRPVVAALAAAVVLAGAGTAAANDWLPIFRTERVGAVSLSTADVMALPDLSAYGDVAVTRDGDVHRVRDAAAAAAETGVDVPELAVLPRGVTGGPEYRVGGKVSIAFTFAADRAERAAAGVGERMPSPPPGLDGSQVRLVAGPGVAAVWSQAAGVPALVVGRAVAPTAVSAGVPFEVVRDYLLSFPGLPANVAAQLRAFSNGSTLPLPVPGDHVTSSTARVHGVPATVLATRDATMAAVVWVDDGVVTAVAGAFDADEVLAIAGEVR